MLRDKFPRLYNDNSIMVALWSAEDIALQEIKNHLDNNLNEMFIDTMNVLIERMEDILGLPHYTTKTLDERRSLIKSKLRGYGTVTSTLIKNICDAYTNGDVIITEKPDNYEFDIKFTSVRGIPTNLSDLQNVIHIIKPAHLNVTYSFTYTTWNRLDSLDYDWNMIDSLNKTWNEMEVL
jgi:uncharacterized protein YmfQ (DUF2313 family)